MATNVTNLLSWSAQVLAAAIFAMALVPKFLGAPEAIATFTELGVEPWGRLLVGFLELGATILLLMPRRRVIGALLASMLMVGALASHITVLGFSGNAGAMAVMAVVALISSATVVALHRDQVPVLANRG